MAAVTQAAVVAATPETPAGAVAALMLAAMVATVWVLVLRHPVGLLVAPEAAAWAAMVVTVEQQIEQEKQQNPPHETKLPEMRKQSPIEQ